MSEEKKYTVSDFTKGIVMIKFQSDYVQLERILDVGNVIYPSFASSWWNGSKNKYLYCLRGNDNKLHLHISNSLIDVNAPIVVTEKDIFTIKGVNPVVLRNIVDNSNKKLERANVLLQDMEETFSKFLEVATRKNSDYGGKDSNPFQNFSNSEIVGVSIPKGIMVRMMDKVSRISTLLEKEAQVKDEAIEDTLDDLINYTAILKSYLKRNK